MKNSRRFYRKRVFVMLVVFLFMMAFLLGSVAYIQLFKGEEYAQRAREQQTSRISQVLTAQPGTIYDRNMNVLAETETTYDVIVDPLMLQSADQEEQESTLTELVRILKLKDRSVLEKYLTSDYSDSQYERFSEGMEVSEYTKVQIENGISDGEIVGVWLEAQQTRQYPNNELAAHVIGFNGLYGIEGTYQDEIQGTDGLYTSVTLYNGETETTRVEAINGHNIISTLDQTVQYYLEKALREGMETEECKSACGIVINPQTFEIYGMAQYPTFNLNDVEEIIGLNKWYTQEMQQEESFNASIWNNMAISSSYEPGSTYKPIFAAAALDCGAITDQDVFECDAVYDYYDQSFKCAYWTAHGEETVREIIRNSCNIGMIKISELISTKQYIQYQRSFGIGSLTGIDLPGEISVEDLVYTEDMGPVERATTSFGQGFNVTPLQLLRAECAVVNGGYIGTPHVVKEIQDENGQVLYEAETTPTRQIISAETCAVIRDGMEAVVQDNDLGENLEGYRIGGKTGTAEEGDYEEEEKAYTVSFVCFAPIDDPQVGVLVILDSTVTNNSSAAIRVAASVLENILPYLNIYPEG